MKFKIDEKDAIIVVDVQRDFCSGGLLEVSGGDQVVPVLNSYIKIFEMSGARIYATRDWHPSNHASFKDYGGIWPSHCIKGSDGAKFHPDLKLPEDAKKISSATAPAKEAYSGFDGTELEEELKKKDVERVFVGGLATEYYVKHTVLDAIRLGFETILLVDAIRGMNIKAKDDEEAVEEMVKKGAKKVTLLDIVEPIEDINTIEDGEKETLRRAEEKKKARLRTRGPYRKSWRLGR